MAVSGAEYMRGMHILVTVNGLFWIIQCVLYIIVAVLDGITFHDRGCIHNMVSLTSDLELLHSSDPSGCAGTDLVDFDNPIALEIQHQLL